MNPLKSLMLTTLALTAVGCGDENPMGPSTDGRPADDSLPGLTLSVWPDGAGDIVADVDSESLALGQEVTVVAAANSGYEFRGWAGDLEGEEPVANVLIDGAMELTAIFHPTLRLEVEKRNGRAHLEWSLAGRENVRFFRVEVLKEGGSWTETRLSAARNTMIHSPPAGKYHYRVRAEIGGPVAAQTRYSNEETVEFFPAQITFVNHSGLAMGELLVERTHLARGGPLADGAVVTYTGVQGRYTKYWTALGFEVGDDFRRVQAYRDSVLAADNVQVEIDAPTLAEVLTRGQETGRWRRSQDRNDLLHVFYENGNWRYYDGRTWIPTRIYGSAGNEVWGSQSLAFTLEGQNIVYGGEWVSWPAKLVFGEDRPYIKVNGDTFYWEASDQPGDNGGA